MIRRKVIIGFQGVVRQLLVLYMTQHLIDRRINRCFIFNNELEIPVR